MIGIQLWTIWILLTTQKYAFNSLFDILTNQHSTLPLCSVLQAKGCPELFTKLLFNNVCVSILTTVEGLLKNACLQFNNATSLKCERWCENGKWHTNLNNRQLDSWLSDVQSVVINTRFCGNILQPSNACICVSSALYTYSSFSSRKNNDKQSDKVPLTILIRAQLNIFNKCKVSVIFG